MCVVSAVHDYFGQRTDLIPGRYNVYPYNNSQTVPANPNATWTRDTFAEYQEVLKRLDALDRKLGQPDCVDPAKEAYMQEIERRLAALETPSKETQQ